MSVTDHYVWRDENTFVGIVADAGEWTLELDTIRAAFQQAQKIGGAEIFSAPQYVVKDYVRELQNYGLAAKAQVAEPGAEGTAWKRRDWQELPPEAKEAAEAGRMEQDPSDGQTASVFITNSDHKSLVGGSAASMKFRAYVELACDAAKKFAPTEDVLNECYAKIRAQGRAAVITDFSLEAAELAVAQLRASGFDAEVEIQATR